jgi:hypothetical protein
LPPTSGQSFSSGFCDDHPENILAKFGYILDIKVGKKKPESFDILGYYWNV